ncbi:SBF-like CPA transporter family-domain-containing protein [Lipomyces tetrasporus]
MDDNERRKSLCFLNIVNFLISEWFIIGMGVFVALAYKFPSVAKNHGHIRADISIEYGPVAIIFLISGLNIPCQKLIIQAAHWQAHLVTQGRQGGMSTFRSLRFRPATSWEQALVQMYLGKHTGF